MRTRTLLVASAVIRVALLVFGELQDRHGPVPYTDIDYTVFTDAARFVSQGKSPYLRSTYRYSPLLAYLLLPNIWVSPVWGKLLFSALDIWVGYLVTRIVKRLGVKNEASLNLAAIAWLYNPYTVTISTRGSCDVLVVALLLYTIECLLQGYAFTAALAYGLAVHLRIYPIIYAPSLVLFLAARSRVRYAQRKTGTLSVTGLQWPKSYTELEDIGLHVALHGVLFGALSGGLFLGLGWVFYKLYGGEFLEEAFLHHVGRKDPRHNFSIYFYTIYLTYFAPQDLTPSVDPVAAAFAAATATEQQLDPVSQAFVQLGQLLNRFSEPATLAFVPQLVLLVAISCKLHSELPLCWLALTMVFVAFNKVCTAQYFVWWLSLVPLLLHHLPRPVPRGLLVASGLWVVSQLHWLAWGYLLEFKGAPVYLALWAASVVFLAANVFLLTQLLVHIRPKTSFLGYSVMPEGGDSALVAQDAMGTEPAAGSTLTKAAGQAVAGTSSSAGEAAGTSQAQTRASARRRVTKTGQ